MPRFTPQNAAEAAEIIAQAAAGNQPLEIIAGASKRALGRPVAGAHGLDISALRGIISYEPAELVLTVHAATRLCEIEAALSEHQQMLAFEPPDWRGLLGGGGEPTLGGVVACNQAGPRRVRAGAARDYFLGFSAINGWGEPWKAGGKVVKNVTGYDMSKLQAGAFGTLSVLTEITLKVMPKPQTAVTILLPGLADAVAIPLLSQALNTPYEISGVAHLPAAVARRSGVAGVAQGGGAVTALRLEGHAPSVAFRADAAEALLGRWERLDAAQSAQFWREVGEVSPLLPAAGRIVWRLCPTPSAAPELLHNIIGAFASAEAYYDWGGGLLWLSLEPEEAGPDAGAAVVRGALARAGGHATLIVAPAAVRAAVPVFEPLAAPLEALARRVKQSFDPRGILNPGRIQQGH
jgi:glycolate oxidase FAD binding subunit